MFIIYKRNLNLVALILTIIILSVLLIPLSAQVSRSPSAACKTYASNAVKDQRENLKRRCGYRGNRWQTNYNNHYKWCVGNSAQRRASETKARKDKLRRCRSPQRPPAACKTYASTAVRDQGENLKQRCGYQGRRWQTNYKNHYKWCVGNRAQRRASETKARKDKLRRCTNIKPIEYVLDLRADKRRVLIGKEVKFRGKIRPGSENIRYRFYYGDGQKSGWLKKPVARHIYTKIGKYYAYLVANIAKRALRYDDISLEENIVKREFRSNKISIDVNPIAYRLDFKVEPNSVIGNQRISFTATIYPPTKKVRYRFDFDDGKKTKWIRENQIFHRYKSPGSYYPSVEVRIGKKTIVKKARIKVKPIAYTVGLKADKRNVLIGEKVKFRGGIRPSNENVRYRFDYGDGEKSTWLIEPISSHMYIKSGLKHAYLEAKVGKRKLHSEKISIDVSEIQYTLQFKANPSSTLLGEQIEFTALLDAEAPNFSYQFDFDDGKKTKWIRENQIFHRYKSPGSYYPSVEVRIGKKSIVKKVRIKVKPIAYTVGLKVDKRNVLIGEKVKFRGEIRPESENVRYRFDYGDGEKSEWLIEPVASHMYIKSGLKHAYLEAKIGKRKLYSEKISINVSDIQYTLQFEANPSSILLGEQVAFIALLDAEAPNASYWFDFGDGERSGWIDKGQIEHLYESPGTYRPFIKVKIGEQTIVEETTVEVKTIKYTIGLKVDKQDTQVGKKIRFEGSMKPIGENVQYRFFFGDDKNSAWLNEPVSEHIYTSPGTYHAYLIARIGNRSLNSEKISIDVSATPYTLQFEANPSSPLLGEEIEFTALLDAEAPNASYRFDFGDGEVHAQRGSSKVMHVYRTPGVYNVSVTIGIGQRSVSKTIRVMVQEQQVIVPEQWPPLWIVIVGAVGTLAAFGGSTHLYRRRLRNIKAMKYTEAVITMHQKNGNPDYTIEGNPMEEDVEIRLKFIGDAGTQEIQQGDNLVDEEWRQHE